uniref:Uncharacterized protein n=1 Tax=virus sp. ctkyY8 TaxID=2827995 RepID=A0A8S5RF14_9VIRU|nr:MAG TPA: hypothetical protein [virus sp. ctkyY8]
MDSSHTISLNSGIFLTKRIEATQTNNARNLFQILSKS